MTNEFFMSRLTMTGHPLVDGMHAFDNNGLCNIVTGSTLLKLVREEHRLGPNQQARMDAINAKMDTFYSGRSVSCRLKNLRIQDLKLSDGTDEWAMMHGKRCKAAATRHIAPFVASLAREYFDGPHPKHRSIVKVAESLCGIYDVLYSSDMFLTDVQLAELRQRTISLGRHFMQCREHARE
jgi:hypothetical protein